MPNAQRPAILGGEPIRPSGPPPWPGHQSAVTEAVLASLRSGSWGNYCGPSHALLERELGEFFGSEHVILCASGTSAVELALRGAKVGPGDEVILAAYDFKANFQNVLAVGAIPVLVDVRADDWQMDAQQLAAATTEKTRAIIVSHLHGAFADIDAALQFASERGLVVIEDACQCPGATLAGRRAGSIGHVAALSFGGSKLLSAGRGGAVLTSRPEITQRIKLYTQRGNDAYPLSELQAAALVPQVTLLDEFNRKRLKTVQLLAAELARVGAPLRPISQFAATAAAPAPQPPLTENSPRPGTPGRGGGGEGPGNDSCGPSSECSPGAIQASAVDSASMVPLTPSPSPRSTRARGASSYFAEDSGLNAPAFYKVGFQYDSSQRGGLSRDHFAAAMRAEGIALDPGFRGLHLIHSRQRFRAVGSLSEASRADAGILILHHPMLLEGASAVSEFVAACGRVCAHASDIREVVLPPA